jgi:hypothetical protein
MSYSIYSLRFRFFGKNFIFIYTFKSDFSLNLLSWFNQYKDSSLNTTNYGVTQCAQFPVIFCLISHAYTCKYSPVLYAIEHNPTTSGRKSA